MPTDHVAALLNALALLDDSLALVGIAKNHNPSDDESRALDRLEVRLEAERTVLQAEVDAAVNDGTNIQGPSAAQVTEIGTLTDQVEQATNNEIAVSDAITLASSSLDVLTSIVTDS